MRAIGEAGAAADMTWQVIDLQDPVLHVLPDR
jgi:hypothetical protein